MDTLYANREDPASAMALASRLAEDARRDPRDFAAHVGGSRAKAERHLRASLTYNPDSTISHYFLAELFIDTGHPADARAELQRVSSAPLSREWAPEDRDFKRRAAALLLTLK